MKFRAVDTELIDDELNTEKNSIATSTIVVCIWYHFNDWWRKQGRAQTLWFSFSSLMDIEIYVHECSARGSLCWKITKKVSSTIWFHKLNFWIVTTQIPNHILKCALHLSPRVNLPSFCSDLTFYIDKKNSITSKQNLFIRSRIVKNY